MPLFNGNSSRWECKDNRRVGLLRAVGKVHGRSGINRIRQITRKGGAERADGRERVC